MAGGLPRSRTPFFGRQTALSRIEGLLGDHRLVTLTGVGGAGKTRLALRVAEEIVPDPVDEVLWVGLASLTDGGLVWSAACTGAGVRLQAGASPVDALTARLEPTGALLVLDNCEHVLDGCAELATELLDRCPRVRILATSREPLGLAEEVRWPVLGLSGPSTEDGARVDVSTASRSESVQLFVDRVRAARPEFELTPDNVDAVVRVCRQLEGIPLALELAAARGRALGPEQIAARLEEGLGVLSQTGRGVPARHRTMRATLSWSHDLLEESQRVLFRRLGVIGGDASIQAVEAVCATASADRPRPAYARPSDLERRQEQAIASLDLAYRLATGEAEPQARSRFADGAALAALQPVLLGGPPEFLERRGRVGGVPGLHPIMAEEVLNLVDGSQTAEDIFRTVAAQAREAGRHYYGTVTPNAVREYLENPEPVAGPAVARPAR